MTERIWDTLRKKYPMSDEQLAQLERYAMLLDQWNTEKSNLTRITAPDDVVAYHFEDSLALSRFIDCAQLRGIADVGSGGGFPGLPLKILFPHLFVILIEVNAKKRAFLESVIADLGLSGIEVCDLDWRTFLRTTAFERIDLFTARASLHTDELLRVFKPGSFYRSAQLVYWGARTWQPEPGDRSALTRTEPYHVGDRDRLLVFFSAPKKGLS